MADQTPRIHFEDDISDQPNRLPAEIRFQRDPHFRVLVETFRAAIRQAIYTPTEIREAALLAAILHERETLRPLFLPPDGIGR